MKTIAKLLTGLTLAILLFVGYYALSSRLSVTARATVTPAAQNAQAFEDAARAVSEGAYEGVSALDTIDAYSIVTIDVRVKNYSLFAAEWAQFTPKDMEGDVLVLARDAGPKDVPSFQTGNFSVTLLTTQPNALRGGWVEYYIFGRFHSIQAMPDEKSAEGV